MNDDSLRALWRAAGGDFYGPKVETGKMPESQLLPFLRSLIQAGKVAATEGSPIPRGYAWIGTVDQQWLVCEVRGVCFATFVPRHQSARAARFPAATAQEWRGLLERMTGCRLEVITAEPPAASDGTAGMASDGAQLP